jgi:NADP-dependent 3-hydroxy acid dehydrogenase YdfG
MDGKVAMVTGASAGIGRAVAREMVGRGGRVAMVARRSDRLAELEVELGSAVMAVPADVVDAIVRRRRESVITAHGKVLVFMARHLPRTTAFIMRRVAARRQE